MVPVVDGFEASRQQRQREATRDTTVTTRGGKSDTGIGSRSGRADDATKSVDVSQLLAKLRNYLASGNGGPGRRTAR